MKPSHYNKYLLRVTGEIFNQIQRNKSRNFAEILELRELYFDFFKNCPSKLWLMNTLYERLYLSDSVYYLSINQKKLLVTPGRYNCSVFLITPWICLALLNNILRCSSCDLRLAKGFSYSVWLRLVSWLLPEFYFCLQYNQCYWIERYWYA